MNYAAILTSALGSPTAARTATAEAIGSVPGAPPNLAALWRELGWTGFRQGFFWTTYPPEFTEIVSGWRRIPKDALVIGRDAFANLYLLEGEEVRQLNVHRD